MTSQADTADDDEQRLLDYLVENGITETTVEQIGKEVPRYLAEQILKRWQQLGLVRTHETYSSTVGARMMNLVSVNLGDLTHYRKRFLAGRPSAMGHGVPVDHACPEPTFRQDYFHTSISQGNAQQEPQEQFDVFLCHNSQDKPEVKRIAHLLKDRGIRPWLDEWQLRPGLPWQEALERQIPQIKAAAVFVGGSGIGPWQLREIDAFLREFVRRGCPVIPVVMSSSPSQPELPLFLNAMTWVDFRGKESAAVERLIWGITGRKPSP